MSDAARLSEPSAGPATSRLGSLTPDVLTPRQRALYSTIAGGPRAAGPQHFRLVDEHGALVGPFGVMLHEPIVGERLQELGTTLRFGIDLSDRVREIAILAAASVTGSSFERYAHERVGKAAGLTQVELDALANGTFEGADDREEAVHRFCRALASGPLGMDAQSYRALHQVLGETTMIDLIVLVGYYVTLAQLLTVFEVPTPTS